MRPSQRSIKLLKDEGHLVDVCERWLPKINVRKDLFGVGDLIAIHPKIRGVLLVQTTTADNLGKRMEKSISTPALRLWIECGNRFELHGWRKLVKTIGRKHWNAIRRTLVLDARGEYNMVET